MMGWIWSYCTSCDEGLRRATPQEVLDGKQYCVNGHENEPNVTKEDLIAELFERVEALEQIVRSK
jgi:hypothetical protein